MTDFRKIRKAISNQENLERKLYSKELQIRCLMNITQAINNNLSATELYAMYGRMLTVDMDIKKVLLYTKGEDATLRPQVAIGFDKSLLKIENIEDTLTRFDKLANLYKEEDPLLKAFDVVIPVRHKDMAIGYTFIGGLQENEELYEKIQFIQTITNIIGVALENKRLFNRQLEQERLRHEIELGSEMQRTLIPEWLPSNDDFELASIYKPNMSVGGDYYDYIDYGDTRFVFCVADISGKGVAAAMVMAGFRANLHTLINRRVSAEEFIRDMNNAILETTKGEKFITLFIGEYDSEARQLQYVNAGHNPPILLCKDGTMHRLDKGCTILGVFPELPSLEVGTMHIPEEAMLVTFTDGVTDVVNPAGEYFEEDRFMQFIREKSHLTPSEFNDELLIALDTFREGIGYPDDITVLTCKLFDKQN